MRIARVSTGFCDVPGLTTLNVFTAGCSKRCPGCHNRELWDHDHPGAVEMGAAEIMDKFDPCLHDAVCWLGGEPTEQPRLLETARALGEGGIRQVLYTGLEPHEVATEVMEAVDVVVAGGWRGLPGNGHKTVMSGGFVGPFDSLKQIVSEERAA